MRSKRSSSGVVRLSLCGRAAGRGWRWDKEEKEKGMFMFCVCVCLFDFTAGNKDTKMQRLVHLLPPVDSLTGTSSHAETILGGETGEYKRELNILCLVISQRIDGVHAIFLLLIYIIARRPELYSTARVTTNDPVNDIRM